MVEERRVRIAVVGDVHLYWGEPDVDYFDRSGYDLVLFVGDVAGYGHQGSLPVLRSIGRLRVPALLIPGNHDGALLTQFLAEMFDRRRLADALGRGQADRCREMQAALGAVTLCGYSVHPFSIRGLDFTLLAARPHSMGGSRAAFRRYLLEAYRVGSIEESEARLKELIDGCPTRDLVILAHNGPSGLGDRREDIWGCDFRPRQGDFGDSDLSGAIEHAKRNGKRVLAVVAGHMHRWLKGGGKRTWLVERDGTLYVNAARVPRVFERDGSSYRHHVLLEIGDETVEARDILADGPPMPRKATPARG